MLCGVVRACVCVLNVQSNPEYYGTTLSQSVGAAFGGGGGGGQQQRNVWRGRGQQRNDMRRCGRWPEVAGRGPVESSATFTVGRPAATDTGNTLYDA